MHPLQRLRFAVALTLTLAAPAAWAQTPFGNAIVLNGTNQYVVITNFGNIIPTNEVTVEFWANTTVATGQSAFILNPDSGGNRLNAHLNYGTSPAQGLIYWDFGNISGGGRVGPVDAPANSISNWVHYAFVASQSGNFMSIYSNGVLLATQTGMTPFVRGAYDLDIGGGSNFFSYHGSLDDFRVWNTALSQSQIQANLSVPLTGSETNLVVYYRFDNAGGTVATNSATATGSLYNGAIMGGAPTVPSSVLNIVVTNNADDGAGSLRQAVANAQPGTTITFASTLSGQTITLTNGQIELNNNISIDASVLAGGIQINGNNQSRIFQVDSGATVGLNSLTIVQGNDNGGGGAGINNSGTLTINNSTLADNIASGYGGGIENGGVLTLNQTTLTGNTSPGFAGGSGVDGESSTIVINQSTITGNTETSAGGAVLNYGGALTVNNSIIAGNSGGDIGYGYSSSLTMLGTNLTSGNPLLAALGNYGGTTPTMPPLAGSPAIDAGDDSAASQFATDQRGHPRLSGAHVDIGAVEVNPNTIVTTSSDDGSPGSLRSVIANTTNTDLISFATNLSGQTITLTGGQIELNTNITIDASALANGIQINGNASSRIFQVDASVMVVLDALTITNGSDQVDGNAGGIYNFGTLTVNLCKITGNASSYWGGGINNRGTMTVNQSTISANTAEFACGIENQGTMTLNQSTVSAHSGGLGAGIDNFPGGTLTLNNSTVAGNSCTDNIHGGAGGIWNRGSALTLNNSTIVNNSAPVPIAHGNGFAGGIVNEAALNMTNSIVAGNTNGSGFDIYNTATIALGGGNIIQVVTNDASDGGTVTGPTAITNAPLLAALGNYGGPTQTMPPYAGSPAIGAGIVIAGLTTDQRGYPRLAGAHVDIGAVEAQTASADNPPVLENITRSGGVGGASTFQFTFTNAPGADFTVLTSTNVALPLANWTVLGEVLQPAPGQYQFTDTQATNYPQRFYRVRSP